MVVVGVGVAHCCGSTAVCSRQDSSRRGGRQPLIPDWKRTGSTETAARRKLDANNRGIKERHLSQCSVVVFNSSGVQTEQRTVQNPERGETPS